MGNAFRRAIVKDEEKRLVYGIVYEPDAVDSQGDFAKADEIEKACHQFMIDSQEVGPKHFETSEQLKIVECYTAPQELKINGNGNYLL